MAGERRVDPLRVVLVTGGDGGIGSSVVTWFSERGHRVASADLISDAILGHQGGVLDLPPDPLPGTPNPPWRLPMDVTNEDSVNHALASIASAWGQVDVLVHAAGVVGSGPLTHMATEEWDRVLRVNLTGAFLVARATIPMLRPRAKVVFVSSVNARTGGGELSGVAYAAAKAGTEALTRHLARSLAPGIQVNAVGLGPVCTPMLSRLSSTDLARIVSEIPAERIGEPEEVAELIGFLCSAGADYITGAVVPQNGGQWMG